MRRRRFTPEQIIKIVKEAESDFNSKDICRKYGISEQTFYNWRTRYSDMSIKEARRLKDLEGENRQLKCIVAYLSLDNQILNDLLEKDL